MQKKKNYDQILTQALSWAKDKKPYASPQHKAAFANVVAYIQTGWSGGYGGPSIREHVASRQVGHRPDLPFDEVCALVEPLVFGPLIDAHRVLWETECREVSFDDDPDDLRELE